MAETKVIHINEAPEGWETDPQFSFIGRSWSGYPKGSMWGCRYREREFPNGEALARYEEDLRRNINDSPGYLKQVKALYGKTLVCYDRPNHGTVLVKWANRLNEPQPLKQIGPTIEIDPLLVQRTQSLFDSWREWKREHEADSRREYQAQIDAAKCKFSEGKAFITDQHDMAALLRPLLKTSVYNAYDAWQQWRVASGLNLWEE
jgi:hypothetical protein